MLRLGPSCIGKKAAFAHNPKLLSSDLIGFFADAVPENDGMNRMLVYYVQHISHRQHRCKKTMNASY